MGDARSTSPDWDQLFEIAAAQDGLFTTRQAAEAGYSPQLLVHHMHAGRVLRLRRGIYRIVHFPAGDHEDLAVIWLWSDLQGVFSHQTALALHDLSDVLPSQVHLTLPHDWRNRRLRVPEGLTLHYADIPEDQRQWFGAVPATTPIRTLMDCTADNLPPDLLRDAILDARKRGLVSPDELEPVNKALEQVGGLGS